MLTGHGHQNQPHDGWIDVPLNIWSSEIISQGHPSESHLYGKH